MVKTLVIASLAWPLMLATAVWDPGRPGLGAWRGVVYVTASHLCHQRPERSFHTAGVQWPVCARCSGLYLSAPFGAVAAMLVGRRRRGIRVDPGFIWLALAAVPTALTLVLEWSGIASPGNLVRALAALPLGAMIASVLVRTAAGASRPIE
jgi:uncharacterized membrane protein